MRLNILFLITLLFNLVGCVDQELAPIDFNDIKNHSKNKTKVRSKDESFEEKTIPAMIGQNTITEKTLEIKEEELDKLPSGVLEIPKQTPVKEEAIEPNKELNPENIDVVVPETKASLPENANLKVANLKVISYQVQKDETIEEIANKHNTTVKKIAELNDIQEPYELSGSQILKIEVNPDIISLKNKTPNNIIAKPVSAIKLQKEFVKPLEGRLLYKFGEQTLNGKNNGININAPAGAEIKAVKDGEVIFTGFNDKFGNLIIIKSDALFIAYGHMEDLLLEKGDKVTQNQVIGHVGSTGNVDSPQLHFAIREGKIAVDPSKYIPY
jgi:LysM repeat protein